MSISRRQLLTGVSLGAGATVLSPILQRLQAEVAGNVPTVQRFVFVVEGNGCPAEQIQPTDIPRQYDGRNNTINVEKHDASLAGHDFSIMLGAPWWAAIERSKWPRGVADSLKAVEEKLARFRK